MNKKTLDQDIIKEVTQFIQKVKYGEVVITVHNSEVVQIEKKEKKRYVSATTPVAHMTNISHGRLDKQRSGGKNKGKDLP